MRATNTPSRQDRNREALEEESRGRPRRTAGARAQASRSLLKAWRQDRAIEEQQLAHFHVRYDGEAHEDVGREILG